MLKSLYLHNYKSFYDTTIEFDKFNCLIGPNNAGKSNLIDALEFFDIALRKGVDVAVKDKGRLSKIKNYHNSENRIIVKATFDFSKLKYIPSLLIQTKYKCVYSFQIVSDQDYTLEEVEISGKVKSINFEEEDNPEMIGKDAYSIFHDKEWDIENFLSLHEGTIVRNPQKYVTQLKKKRFQNFSLRITKHKGQIDFSFDKLVSAKQRVILNTLFEIKTHNRSQLVEMIHPNNIVSFRQTVTTHFFIPDKIKSETKHENFALNRSGTNLIEYLIKSRKSHPDKFEELSNSVIGEIEMLYGIEIDESLDIPALKFIEDIGNDELKYIGHRDVSDGTIHFIAILTSVMFPSATIVMIEEPERNMHMKTLSYLLDEMRESESQVLITTHSSEILSELTLDEMLFVYRGSEGNTNVKKGKDIKNIKSLMKRHKNDIVALIKEGILDNLEDA